MCIISDIDFLKKLGSESRIFIFSQSKVCEYFRICSVITECLEEINFMLLLCSFILVF